MVEMLAVLVVIVGLVTFSITLAIRWAVRQMAHQVERRFRHADALVNDGQIPAEWLEPFRAEVERLRTAGAAESDIRRVADRAQIVCLRNIDTLIGFFENSPFVDNAGTRALLLDELRQQRQHWTAAEWVTLVQG
ncbi:MAG TPA: hypothetical protein VKY59_13990 [Spirillospora sp.]|nr:hypothetical protein [Spirillospora sp.]